LLLAAVTVAIYPYLVMLFGALKSPSELTGNPAGPPASPTTSNFTTLLSGSPGSVMWRSLGNSIFITACYTLISVMLSAMAGYGFAKHRFRGQGILFALLIASMLVPNEVNIPSLYLIFSHFGWIDTYRVQIIPGTASVLGMFMARQYMRALPDEVIEAARMDGASSWRIFTRIILPICAPVLSAIAVLTFTAKWSDYLWPTVMVNSTSKEPVMVTLPQISTAATGFVVDYTLLLAGCLLITVPLLIAFARLQKSVISGATAGAVRQ